MSTVTNVTVNTIEGYPSVNSTDTHFLGTVAFETLEVVMTDPVSW